MKYLQVNEKQYPIWYGWGGLELFEELTGVNARDFEQLKEINLKQTRLLIYAGFANGCETVGKEIDFTKEDIIKWLDNDLDLLENAMEVLLESMPKAKETIKKKKPQGKK